MEPRNLSYGGGVTDSVFSPIALILVLIAGLLICVLPRRKAVVAFLTAGILIPFDQILVIGGFHFQMLRILALFGFARMAWAKISRKHKIFSGGINGIDWAVIVLTLSTAISGVLLWQTQGAITFQIGTLITVFGVYFLLRYLIQDWHGVRESLRALAFVCVVVAGFMVYERITGRNLIFEALGGSMAFLANSAVRADAFRAAGPFAHPIIAGTFGGFTFPLFIGWWSKEKNDRMYAGLGALAASVIPLTAGSSTALFALLSGIGALCLWCMRRRLRMLRWAVVGLLVAAQMYMKSPVWHLIDDVSLSADSSSYHRYQLVNQCILHFWDWVLIGTKDYASWGWDMWDLANQYVATADTAGLIPLIAFMAIFVIGFKYIGRTRRLYEGDRQQEFFVWAIGGSLFANAVGFFGIGYWDQVIVPWYMVLAIIAAITLPARAPACIPAPDADGYHSQQSFEASPVFVSGNVQGGVQTKPQFTTQIGRLDAYGR